ncbi:low molecular weight protein arginine phosphatase [Clostridium sp. 19966]|uniref:low molecular weight protein arginine phosphatase n=1 Tax=Clostridium sp. 19966 TaxID=2768166 RepID=UPI0028DE9F6E|nr:low molecular weight protein arginine phosphatase [Clostridium sp. 19966]MDT8715598.1 low molecular weight protein arginine phosphatase [Clostridium sp. 19966]
MNILFVCTGNTCRSCMAEAIFNSINDLEDYMAVSAGAAAIPSTFTSVNSAKIVKDKLGVDISKRASVKLDRKHLEEASLILTMTKSIRDYLVSVFPELKNKIYSLNEYVGKSGEISDPYGGSIEIYSSTFEQLMENIKLLIAKLKGDNSIS